MDFRARLIPPKKPWTAFFLFASEVREQVKQKYPDKKIAEIAKIMGEMYQELSPEEKQNYQDRYIEDKKIFDREFEQYKAKHGSPEKKRMKAFGNDEEEKEEPKKNKTDVQPLPSQRESTETKDNMATEANKPTPPKKPSTAYLLFANEMRQQVQEKYPDKRASEIFKMLGEMYKELSAEERQKYDNVYIEDKKRYETELVEYKAKYGTPEKKRKKVFGQGQNDEANENF